MILLHSVLYVLNINITQLIIKNGVRFIFTEQDIYRVFYLNDRRGDVPADRRLHVDGSFYCQHFAVGTDQLSGIPVPPGLHLYSKVSYVAFRYFP